MTRLFHFSVLLISLILILSYAKLSYQQTGKINEIKTEINKSNEDKYKKIEEENIILNQKKDVSVRNASIVLVIIIIIITIIFLFIGKLKKCPSCKKIFAEEIIGCTPIKENDEYSIKSDMKYSIKRNCIFCGHQWRKIETKMRKIKESDDDFVN
jgi:quinol-cytochrome oxidoreductase complex cytochrome b subunit